ncbi:antibiotic biosynthesis monooxygenase family protein [Variovorax sp. RA8]|jgi:heme-degrading monooxygenase HmoA|uniref:antibiotic biosynthesis monooxygenase family protein n=1 Tax=Variovorax sp. (strain JCM 16519 / RA8) TaxID=662548 RepID=UPI001316C0C9|nr:antibiotic biosynthesis monooxygenase family protein [Variovorax sp. RA8]VTU20774.1 Antibiotic biosynthesis monooxygenase [Variovorax sp. RA8]
MLICIIEFKVLPGMEQRNREMVAQLLVAAAKIDGFVSKESFLSRDNEGKLISLSYWRDAEALRAWMRDADHRRAIPIGKNELFQSYTIQIAELVREKVWTRQENK